VKSKFLGQFEVKIRKMERAEITLASIRKKRPAIGAPGNG
jgi:hypothetical protein